MSLAVWEVWAFAQVPLAWWLFKRYAKRDIAGDIAAGMLLSLFMEFATEPLWDYNFHFTVYRDVPLVVPPAWGLMFALTVYASERLYAALLGSRPDQAPGRGIVVCDILAGVVIGVMMEKTGLAAGIWTYRLDLLDWSWPRVPLLDMPSEAILGYVLMMFSAPTFVRSWRRSLLEAAP